MEKSILSLENHLKRLEDLVDKCLKIADNIPELKAEEKTKKTTKSL